MMRESDIDFRPLWLVVLLGLMMIFCELPRRIVGRLSKVRFLFLVAVLLLGAPAFAQTSSQVFGTFSTSCNLTLRNPLALGTSTFPLQTALISANTISGPTGVNTNGPGAANQLYAAQYLITNGAAFGLNMINLNTFSNVSDAVGNNFSLRNLKWIAFQNLGQAGFPNESNVLKVTVPLAGVVAGAGWTNYLTGDPNIGAIIPGPSVALTLSNTPLSMFWAPGDIGWPVGTGNVDNLILLTNPIATSGSTNVLTVNVYVMGSTSQ
jgi:hypothetical protein